MDKLKPYLEAKKQNSEREKDYMNKLYLPRGNWTTTPQWR